MKYDFRILTAEEQPAVLPLLGRCFPDYWEQLALRQNSFPFEEISFAALDGSTVIGHCGIIPYDIYCGNDIYSMAGIASVATAPEYRKLGIARKLCQMAADWAEKNGFVSLPLYTAHFHVYEVNSWHKLEVPPVLSIKTDSLPQTWRTGKELTANEKAEMIRLYDDSEIFDGKVLRKNSGTLHSWERIFAEPEFLFAKIPGTYAIKSGGVIVETAFAPETTPAQKREFFSTLGTNGTVECYLPPTAENLNIITPMEHSVSAIDAMHGERPMVRDTGKVKFHCVNNIFFPVTDKF